MSQSEDSTFHLQLLYIGSANTVLKGGFLNIFGYFQCGINLDLILKLSFTAVKFNTNCCKKLQIVLYRLQGSGAFLTPGSGKGKKSGSGSRLNNPEHIYDSLETTFWVKILKFFDADPGWTNSYPGWKKFGSRIRDKHPGSATLIRTRI
jgi:hypothetical protein